MIPSVRARDNEENARRAFIEAGIRSNNARIAYDEAMRAENEAWRDWDAAIRKDRLVNTKRRIAMEPSK